MTSKRLDQKSTLLTEEENSFYLNKLSEETNVFNFHFPINIKFILSDFIDQ